MNSTYILEFLHALQQNNSKVWMDAHREQYLQAKGYFTELVAYALAQLQTIDGSLLGVQPPKCIFRINKNDFSKKGEAPYKGRIGAGMSRDGRHSPYANYILVLEPGGRSRVGGGMPNPKPRQVELIREEIDYCPGELEKILATENFKEQFGILRGEKLKSMPKGYTKAHPGAALLQHKNFVALRYFSDEEVCQPSFLERLLPLYKTVKPLHDFLNRTVPENDS